MPTKHIDDETWRKIELRTVQTVIETRKSVKESEMLKRLILIGLKHYDKEKMDLIEKDQKTAKNP